MYKSPDGWSKYTETWSVRTLYNMSERGQLNFDWDRQRGFVWNKSLSGTFIHSAFWGMLDKTETFHFTKHDNIYFCTDGKQRGTTLLKFVKGKLKISGVTDKFPIYLSDGTKYSIRGKFFHQLPQELQDKIWDLQINISVLDNASHEVEAEMFKRYNSNIKVSKTDISICKNTNAQIIDSLGQHELFEAMYPNAAESKKYRPVIIKTWIAMSESEPNYNSKNIHKIEENLNLTQDDVLKLTNLYDNLLQIYKYVILQKDNTGTKMFNNNILYYYIPYLDMFDNDWIKAGQWINYFCKNIPDEYSQIQGFSIDDVNVKNKMSIIRQSIINFMNN